MKIVLMMSLVTLITSVGFAASKAQNFLGSYRLTKSQDISGDTFCLETIEIELEKDGMLSLYRGDMRQYGPMVSATLNGKARKVTSKHGEAMGSSSGEDTVKLVKNILTFDYKGVGKVFGVPATRESDVYEFAVVIPGKTLTATRTTFEGVVKGIGKKGKVQCTYSNIN